MLHMNRDIPVETSFVRAKRMFREDPTLPSLIVRARYDYGALEKLLWLRAGAISIARLRVIVPYLVDDYEEAFSVQPERASRIYGRSAGAHIDTGANAPVMHLELTKDNSPRDLYVVEAGNHTLRASRDEPKSFEAAKAELGIVEDTYSRRLQFGDLTLMRNTLHEFRLSNNDVSASALRISQ